MGTVRPSMSSAEYIDLNVFRASSRASLRASSVRLGRLSCPRVRQRDWSGIWEGAGTVALMGIAVASDRRTTPSCTPVQPPANPARGERMVHDGKTADAWRCGVNTLQHGVEITHVILKHLNYRLSGCRVAL